MRSLVGTVLGQAPVRYVAQSFNMPWQTRTDAVAQMSAYGQSGTLFPVVNYLASAVSLVEWSLYRKAKSGNKEDRTEVTDHLAAKVWNKPNKWMTRQELVESAEQHVELTGEGWLITAYASKSAAMRIPTELWPARPDRMAPVPGYPEFIQGYIYTGPTGEQIPFGTDEVMMIRMPNPLDPYRGLGAVQTILVDIDASRYSREWNRNFFINSAQPGGIIEVEKSLSPTEWNKLRERWSEQHRGVSNAHRVAILEMGAKWKDVAFSMRDMQFAELQNVGVDVVRRAFGMTKFDLGDVDDVNRATAVASEYRFAKRLLKPRLERWKSMLNNDFLPQFGSTSAGLEFDYVDPAPEDEEGATARTTAKATAAKTYIDAGFTGESVKEALELPEALEWEKPEPPPPPTPPLAPGSAPVDPAADGGAGAAPGQPKQSPAPPATPTKPDDAAKARAYDLVFALAEGRPSRADDGVRARFLYDD